MKTINSGAQQRLVAISGTLTGTDGPLRTALDELGRVGIGERILKSAIAATLAWGVAGLVPRESAPFVAALTALYTIDLTLLKSLRAAGQRVAGIAIGIALALAVSDLVGMHAWSAGLVILVSLMVGSRLRLNSDGMAQVAATAVLVLVVRSTTSERGTYAAIFLLDTVIGTAVGLAVNALVAPPNPLPRAQAALGIVVNRVISVMDQLAATIATGMTREEAQEFEASAVQLRRDLANVQTALANATESMRFNLIALRKRTELDHFQSIEVRLSSVIESLNRCSFALGAAAAEPWMVDREFTGKIADLVSALTYVVIGQGPIESRDRASDATMRDLLLRMYELDRAAEVELIKSDDIRWTYLGQVVANCRELSDAVLALNTPPPSSDKQVN